MDITCEEFINIMKHFEDKRDFGDKFRAILAEYKMLDFVDPYCFDDIKADDIIIQLLMKIFNDEDNWISYWVCELDCGRDWTPGMVTDNQGNDICLSDSWHLWNLLMENLNGNN